MQNYEPSSSFGPDVAACYDNYLRGDEEAAVRFLASLAEGGQALEFAIGTGRIAIPLAEMDIQVDGIDLSPHMVNQLYTKTGDDRIKVIIGDMSSASTNHKYKLVYLVYNTIFNLLTVEDQIRCFENAVHHLTEEGRFVVETALPHAWIAPGNSGYVHAENVETHAVTLDVACYDPVTQLLKENHVQFTENGIKMNPIVCRLITPGEMDLMARIAGLQLLERYANWEKSPFDAHSRAHVSVYGILK